MKMMMLLMAGVAICWSANAQTNVTNRFVETPVWEQPHVAEISLSWAPSPDAAFYRIYARSNRTTNRWVSEPAWLIATPSDREAQVTASIFVDLSVPVWTRVTAVSEGQLESVPTNPVKHMAIVAPRPPGQHRFMFSRPVEGMQPVRRARMAPQVVPPMPR